MRGGAVVPSEKVQFFSQGLGLSGIYHRPDGEARGRPTVVVCGGLGAIKEMIVPDIASRLVASGYKVFSFDYRGFGESAGTRFRLIPSEQVADVRSAVSFLSTLDQNSAFVLYGNSFGAGVAIDAAAKDQRIGGVITVVGVFDGADWLRSLRPAWQWQEFTDAIESDRLLRASQATGTWVEPREIMPADPESQKWAAEVLERFPQRAYRLSLEAAAEILEWRPVDVVTRLAPRPLLVVTAERDVLVPPRQSIELHARAREPKTLVCLRGARHHDATGGPRLTEALDEVERWLGAHFPVQAADRRDAR